MNKCFERVNDRHFWNSGVFSYAMIPRCHRNSRVFFFYRYNYSLMGENRVIGFKVKKATSIKAPSKKYKN
jgi:hypothetical protein